MSKKSKFDSKSKPKFNINRAKGKVFNSLSEFGEATGLKVFERRERTVLCPQCGTKMNNIPGTNVYLCPAVNDEGAACGKRLLWREKTAV